MPILKNNFLQKLCTDVRIQEKVHLAQIYKDKFIYWCLLKLCDSVIAMSDINIGFHTGKQ